MQTRIVITDFDDSSMKAAVGIMAEAGFQFSSYGQQGGVRLGLVHLEMIDAGTLKGLANRLATELNEPRLSMVQTIR